MKGFKVFVFSMSIRREEIDLNHADVLIRHGDAGIKTGKTLERLRDHGSDIGSPTLRQDSQHRRTIVW